MQLIWQPAGTGALRHTKKGTVKRAVAASEEILRHIHRQHQTKASFWALKRGRPATGRSYISLQEKWKWEEWLNLVAPFDLKTIPSREGGEGWQIWQILSWPISRINNSFRGQYCIRFSEIKIQVCNWFCGCVSFVSELPGMSFLSLEKTKGLTDWVSGKIGPQPHTRPTKAAFFWSQMLDSFGDPGSLARGWSQPAFRDFPFFWCHPLYHFKSCFVNTFYFQN